MLTAGDTETQAGFTYLADTQPPVATEPPPADWTPARRVPNGRRPAAPLALNLALQLKVDTKLQGARAGLSGGGLKPNSKYILEMFSAPVTVTSGLTDGQGDFRQTITMPGKACVPGGLHRLVLTGIAPNGYLAQATQWIVLDDSCIARAVSATAPANGTIRLRSFLFAYKSAALTASDKSILNQLASGVRGARVITITGYTQTQNTSAASIKANKVLAMQRATNVRNYLQGRGVKAKFVLVGKGPVDPVSRKDQKLNRRVSIDATY